MLRKIQVHTHLNSGIKIKTFNFVCPVQCHSLHFTRYTLLHMGHVLLVNHYSLASHVTA